MIERNDVVMLLRMASCEDAGLFVEVDVSF